MIKRKQIQISGIVQSVGFRPYIYSLAIRHQLNGRVRNNERGVLIDIEGDGEAIDQFLEELERRPPSLARIDAIECRSEFSLANYHDFVILDTEANGRRFVPVSPDVSTCADCLRELFDPANRRYRYPFINCTNCGPRFTIIEDVPYDRAKTTMREFEMCADCRSEYEDPLDRRFHAEPTACARCGPSVYLLSRETQAKKIAAGDAAIEECVSLLMSGSVVAIKGVGGFHLACDALNGETVKLLRERKYREDKPFALMAKSSDVVHRHCEMSNKEEELLLSRERPIVIMKRKSSSEIPEAVAPRVNTLGFMLPYSPLHYLVLENFDGPLVMTSANISDEPICYEDDEARTRLANIAGYYLMHNRRIHMRTDDSIAALRTTRRGQETEESSHLLRRSRGFAPAPIKTAFRFDREILACGAELKNTFCMARDDSAFVSHHIGDLKNLETMRSFVDGIAHFQKLFYLAPSAVAYDLHPDYLSTKYALSLEEIETKIGVQHHHAHVASCMADNRIDGDVIGVAMDGLGFGTDGRFWGGEFFVANFAEARQIAHLDYVPMPGGAKAIQEPWRMAAVYLQRTFGDQFLQLDLSYVRELDRKKWKTLSSMIESGTNCAETSSMGRLFDAVASLLRLRDSTNYEGQAAIELEQVADLRNLDQYEFAINDGGVIKAEEIVRRVVQGLLQGEPAARISAKFHLAVADLIVRMSLIIRDDYKLNRIVLSGGVFQNLVLLNAVSRRLDDAGFEVFAHRRVPANDGGISLGQAAIANARLQRRKD